MTVLPYDSVTIWLCDDMTVWWYDCVTKYYVALCYDCVTIWLYDYGTTWLCFLMTVWQHDCVMIWLCDKILCYLMTVWKYDCVTIWLCDNMTLWQFDHVTIWRYSITAQCWHHAPILSSLVSTLSDLLFIYSVSALCTLYANNTNGVSSLEHQPSTGASLDQSPCLIGRHVARAPASLN